MLKASPISLKVRELTLEEVRELLSSSFVSAVGHQATAEIISALTGAEVPFNRAQISLCNGDKVLVFQLLTRLEEGRVLSPEELRFKIKLVFPPS